MKKSDRIISVFLCAALCASLFTAAAQAKSAKKYVKSLSVKTKAELVIPANKKTAEKSFKVTVKVSGKASKGFTAKSDKSSVASVKVSGSKIKITAKKAGTAKIKITTKAKSKKGKKLSKTMTVTVKKAKSETKKPSEPKPTEPKPSEPEPTEPEPTEPKPRDPEPDDPDDPATASTITIYFANNKSWSEVNVEFFNRSTGDSVQKKMKYTELNDLGEEVYRAKVDLAKYDRAVFGNGTDKTTDTPVTKASSGFFISSGTNSFNGKYLAGVYTYGKQDAGKLDTVKLNYPKGYQKTVYIRTPEGYNPEDKSKKYSVLYMTDGQNLFGTAGTRTGREWCCDETVQTLMNSGKDGVIIVGIVTNDDNRFSELTPKIGKLSSSLGEIPPEVLDKIPLEGKTFSDFVVNDVITYVDQNYNTSSVRGIAGSSSGGLEAFYIGLENPDKFSYAGVLSPCFDFFDDEVWNEYLGKKDFSGEMPIIYLYNGNSDKVEKVQYTAAVAMDSRLRKMGYPAEKLTSVFDEDGAHNEGFWAIYFPEMLCRGLQITAE